jgi:GNAT superfamily N-acetyltransferase
MQVEDLLFAAECTNAEGWVSENIQTLHGFFLNQPKGCLVAEENGHPVGICIATQYGRSGFIGELIVRLEARGRGIGACLLNHGVHLLRENGAESVYLDGVVKAVELYERNGFRKVCRSWRFSGTPAGEPHQSVRRMTHADLPQLSALDRGQFGADRSFFIQYRLELFPHLCHVMLENGNVVGYVVGRNGNDWVSAGPWVVSESVNEPEALLNALALEAGKRPITLGILDANRRACELVHALGFEAQTDSPWRMALGDRIDLGTSPGCYAVGSSAAG